MEFARIKKYILIIALVLLISILIYYNNSTLKDKEKFNFVIKDNNIICYNKKIQKSDITKFLNFYSLKVNQFYVDNKLTTKRIENERLLIILFHKSSEEWKDAAFFKKKLAFKLKQFYNLEDVTNINDVIEFLNNNNFYVNQDNVKAKYIISDIIPIILIKDYYIKIFPYIFLISEYNHHLINIRLKENKKVYKNEFSDFNNFNYYLFGFLVDEGFTIYLGNYLYQIFGYSSVDNFLYSEKYYLASNEYDKFIFENSRKYYLSILNNENVTFEGLMNLNKKTYYDYKKNFDKYLNICMYFIAYIRIKYGLRKFYEFISNVYNSSYRDIDQIFENNFNCSLKCFLAEVDNSVKNKIDE